MAPPRLIPWVTCRSLAVRLRPRQQQQPRLALVAFGRSFSDVVTRAPPPSSASDAPVVPSPFGLGPSSSSSTTTAAAAGTAAEGAVTASSSSLLGPEGEPGAPPRPGAEAEGVDADTQRRDALMARGLDPFDAAREGHRFAIPTTAWRRGQQLQDRYDPVLTQFTRLLMRDGKLSKAQRDMALILEYLRTSPPPKPHPSRPLLAGAPPPSHLPLDPVRYLTLAVDSVAPLIRVAHYGGLVGGGQMMDVPLPLRLRQRRRIAFGWILAAVARKPSRGSGRKQFPYRVAEEIVAVAEGHSPVWNRRLEVHKLGTAARANLSNRRLNL